MSSTNRGAVRDLDDYYATPPDLARLICQRLAEDYGPMWGGSPINVLEPGCGGGSFLVGARSTWPDASIVGVELSPALAEKARSKGFEVREGDVLRDGLTGLPDFHLIVGNPPFKHAEAFIRQGVGLLDPEFGRLAFLLRLNFLGGQERFASLWKYRLPEAIYVLPARAGFTPDGKSDSIEYMVCVFGRESADSTRLSFLDNRHVKNKWLAGAYEDPRGLWFPEASPPAPDTPALRAAAENTDWNDPPEPSKADALRARAAARKIAEA